MIEKDIKDMYNQNNIKSKQGHKTLPSPQNKTESAIIDESNKLVYNEFEYKLR